MQRKIHGKHPYVSLPAPLISFQLPFIGTDDAERVRTHRRIMTKALGPGTIPSHQQSIETTTRQLLLDLASKETTIETTLLKYDTLLLLTSPSQHL